MFVSKDTRINIALLASLCASCGIAREQTTGALCGLGFDKHSKRPLYTENDIEDVFEIKFDDRDIKQINALRHCVNMLIGETFKNKTQYEQLVKHTKACILELLKKPRHEIEEHKRVHTKRPYYWEQVLFKISLN